MAKWLSGQKVQQTIRAKWGQQTIIAKWPSDYQGKMSNRLSEQKDQLTIRAKWPKDYQSKRDNWLSGELKMPIYIIDL